MKSVLKKTEVIPRSGCLEGILPVPFMVNATQIEVFILNNINHKGANLVSARSEVSLLRHLGPTATGLFHEASDAATVGSPMPPFACHVLGPPAESLGMDAKIPRLGFKIWILESLMSFFVRLKKSHMSPLLLGS